MIAGGIQPFDLSWSASPPGTVADMRNVIPESSPPTVEDFHALITYSANGDAGHAAGDGAGGAPDAVTGAAAAITDEIMGRLSPQSPR